MRILQTERLVLRAFREADLDPYAQICADPEVVRYVGAPFSRAEAWLHIAMMLGHWQLRGCGMWAVEDRSSGAMIGRIGFYGPEGWPGLELGWMLARSHWGRGLGTEGARAALDFAFRVLNKPHIISLIRPENTVSIRVAEKLGECFEGHSRVLGGEALVYGIRREEWSGTEQIAPMSTMEKAPKVTICRAGLGDGPAITDIYNEAILTTTATFDTEPKSVEERTKWLQSHDERHPVLVAVVDGKVVGWASLTPWSDRQAYDHTAETSFYVHSTYRGRGIGRKLQDGIIEEARRLGYHTLIARVAEGSAESIHLNESAGFVHVGTLKEVGRKFDRLLDVHIMQKMLD